MSRHNVTWVAEYRCGGCGARNAVNLRVRLPVPDPPWVPNSYPGGPDDPDDQPPLPIADQPHPDPSLAVSAATPGVSVVGTTQSGDQSGKGVGKGVGPSDNASASSASAATLDTARAARGTREVRGEKEALQQGEEKTGEIEKTEEKTITIFIALNKIHVYRVRQDESVGSLKQRIHRKQGIFLDHLRLTYGGKPLDDEYSLRDYNIQDESAIHATFPLIGRGGASASQWRLRHHEHIVAERSQRKGSRGTEAEQPA
jgi:hypothetical protein